MSEDRNEVGGCLAGARLSLGRHVAPSEGQGKNLSLHACQLLESKVVDRLLDRVREVQVGEPGFDEEVAAAADSIVHGRRIVPPLCGAPHSGTLCRMKIVTVLLTVVLVTPQLVAADNPPDSGVLPESLQLYLSARLEEASREYRAALDDYSKALDANPENAEIRIAYASLLNDLRMAGTAIRLLENRKDLDWYGRRVLAMATAQESVRRTELLADAERMLREVLEERPNDPNVQINLAQVLLRRGQAAEAASVLGEVRKRRPDNQQLALLHARALEAAGQTEEAIDAYRVCSQGPPTGPQCREALSDLLDREGRKAEAGRILLEGSTSDDETIRLHAASLLLEGGSADAALAVLQRVLAQNPQSVEARRLQARALIQLGRLSEAERVLRQVLHDAPGDVATHLSLMWAAVARGQLDEARKRLDGAWKAVSEGTGSAGGVQVCLAGARLELLARRPGAARNWLARIDDPAEAGRQLPVLLAETYRRSKEYRDAVGALLRLQPRLQGEAREVARALEAEMRLRTGDQRGEELLTSLLEKGGREGVIATLQVLQNLERWDALLEGARKALIRFPGDRAVRFTEAAALERLGRLDEAADIFKKLLDEDPKDAAAANYLGYMWADAGQNLEEALELIRTAVEVEPDAAAYLDSLGWVHFKLGNLEEAERWLRRAVDAGNTDGTVLAHLGEVLLASGQKDEARTYLQRALDLGCEHPDHVRKLLDGLDAKGQ